MLVDWLITKSGTSRPIGNTPLVEMVAIFEISFIPMPKTKSTMYHYK